MLFRLLPVLCLIVGSISYQASAFSPLFQTTPAVVRTKALSEQVGRRAFFANTVATAVSAVVLVGSSAPAAFALNTVPADNEIVKEQRTIVEKLDVNNAAVADYMKFPGLYPKIGGVISNNGPYGSVKDVFKLKELSKDEKSKLKKYESELTATSATGLDTMRGRDPYRRSFNE